MLKRLSYRDLPIGRELHTEPPNRLRTLYKTERGWWTDPKWKKTSRGEEDEAERVIHVARFTTSSCSRSLFNYPHGKSLSFSFSLASLLSLLVLSALVFSSVIPACAKCAHPPSSAFTKYSTLSHPPLLPAPLLTVLFIFLSLNYRSSSRDERAVFLDSYLRDSGRLFFRSFS